MRRALLLLVLIAGGRAATAATPLDDATRPDPEIASLVHRVATAALLGSVGELADTTAELEQIDEAREARSLAPTGLTDDTRLLWAALRPTRERLDRESLDQLLDHGRRKRAGIDPILEREREQLDGIARGVGVGAPAQARQGGLQLGQERIDRIARRRRRCLVRTGTRCGIQGRPRAGLA